MNRGLLVVRSRDKLISIIVWYTLHECIANNESYHFIPTTSFDNCASSFRAKNLNLRLSCSVAFWFFWVRNISLHITLIQLYTLLITSSWYFPARHCTCIYLYMLIKLSYSPVLKQNVNCSVKQLIRLVSLLKSLKSCYKISILSHKE